MLYDVKLLLCQVPKTVRNAESAQEDHAGALPSDMPAILLQYQFR
jgi:hypothetical protein